MTTQNEKDDRNTSVPQDEADRSDDVSGRMRRGDPNTSVPQDEAEKSTSVPQDDK